MGSVKLGFEDFIATVSTDVVDFITEMHQIFLTAGAKIEIKEAKSGYVVSYLLHKKTIANYVFRKKGLLVRIYANHIREYMDFLETLPQGMVREIKASGDCKRLLNPADCNPRCAMGYDFLLNGERMQKCRNGAFFFLICEEYMPFIKGFLQQELGASSRGE